MPPDRAVGFISPRTRRAVSPRARPPIVSPLWVVAVLAITACVPAAPLPAATPLSAPQPTLAVGQTGRPPDPDTVPIPAQATCTARNGLPDPACTPGELNPNVSLVRGVLMIRLPDGRSVEFCGAEFTTRLIRPPSSYTNVLKRRQLVAYGLELDVLTDPRASDADIQAALARYEEDHLASLEALGHPWSVRNTWPQPRLGPQNAAEKDRVEVQVARMICKDQPNAFTYAARLAADWRQFIGIRGVEDEPEPTKEPEP